jgi:hypothetical protein
MVDYLGVEVRCSWNVCLLVLLLALILIISLTRYNARWVVEFGHSTQPDAPVRDGGCGPDPFDSTTVEFERSWEVVAAE